MGRSRYKFLSDDSPYFLTCTTLEWIALFGIPEFAETLLNSLRFLQEHNRLIVYAYVIMEHHLHLVASSNNLSKEIGNFKSFTARSIVDYLLQRHSRGLLGHLRQHKVTHKTDRKYQIWQEGSHPEEIISDDMMEQKINYIHNNPVKAGFVDDPVHWRYSSARNYEGMEGILEVKMDW